MSGKDQEVTPGVMFLLDPRDTETLFFLSARVGKQSHNAFLGLPLSYFMFLKEGKGAGGAMGSSVVDWQFCLSFLILILSENSVDGGE